MPERVGFWQRAWHSGEIVPDLAQPPQWRGSTSPRPPPAVVRS